MLMESTPSQVNWHAVNQLKRPGMHLLSSIQAVAHGSDAVQYFQWRKSRGASEKFHGAVVDHCGHEHTRVFRDVAELGEKLKRLDGVVGTTVRPEVAIIYEWDNLWAMGEAQALKRSALRYKETCFEHYNGFWKQGVPVDIINMKSDLSGYKLVIAPMLYMVKPGFDEKIEAFVKGGGSFVTTYWSGRVNENDLCYLGGFPGPLRRLLGVWAEEIDSLYDSQSNTLVISEENELGLSGKFEVHDFCDLINAQTAKVLATYGKDFYKGQPALTVNDFGAGKAYYIAARTEYRFLDCFYTSLTESLSLKKALQTELPEGVTAQLRSDGKTDFVFLMNFSEEQKTITVGHKYLDLLNGELQNEVIVLPVYGVKVLEIKRG